MHFCSNLLGKNENNNQWQRHITQRGFTLLELLLVIAIIAVLASLLLPTLSNAKQAGQSVACVSNLKQLQLAFKLYSDENGQFPSNNFVKVLNYDTIAGPTWAPTDFNGDQNITEHEYGSLYPYFNSPKIFRCPSDKTLTPVMVLGSINEPRVHSYNLSIWFNCISEPHGYLSEPEMNGIRRPPSDIFTFIDTHPESIVDPAFGLYHEEGDGDLKGIKWIDLPSDRHRQGSNMAMLDGHVEHMKWKAPKVFRFNGQTSRRGADREDLRSLQSKLPPPAKRSFWDLMTD